MKNLLNISTALLIITSAFAQAPDTASAVRELPDDRTYFSKTFYNIRDNTYVTRVSAGYVHYLASDGRFKNIDTKLKLDQSGAYYVIDSGLYNVAFAAAIGTGNWDVAYEVPRPVHPKVDNPGKPPAPVTRIRWKMLSYGYFDQSRNRYQVIDYARSVTPVLSSDQRQATSNQITYPQIFSGIDARYLCQNTGVKEEIVLSQSARNALPDPARYGLSRNNSYFVVAMEFLLTPNNINVFARRQGNKTPIKQGNDFVFNGDEAIEFEDENTTLHFFFPKDYAHAVADSVTDFANRANLKRVFYSQNGKHYLLVGVPWAWINSSPAGDLIIDPTTNAATNEDVRLYDAGNYGSDTKLAVGKFPNTGQLKSRSIINFNLASIPSNATVLNAQMKLKYYEAYNNVTGTWVDRWIQAHQLLVGWDEAQADSLHRSNGVNWGAPRGKIGGANPDANGTYESTLLFVQDEALPVWKNWDLTALTQKWISGSAANYGVLLWTTSEDTSGYVLRFYSSEAANTSDRPYLEVIWSNTPQTVYFLKDHLGSIRAAVSDSGKAAAVIGYDDYDAWGYPLTLRTKAIPTAYLQGASKSKFTGKERDEDFGLNWDYFGGRTYDWLIGRWPTVDPLWFEHPEVSPYVYVLNNPMILVDPDGQQVVYHRVVQKPPTPAEIKQNFAQRLEQSKEFAAGGVYTMAAGMLALGALEAAGSALQALDPFGVSSFANPIVMAETVTARGATLADDAILFAQKGVSTEFSKKGIFEGASLESVVGQLKSGVLKADDVPVRFVIIDGQKVAVDNRSLTVLSQAGMKPTKAINVTSDKKIVREVKKRLKEMEGKPSRTVTIRDEEESVVEIIE